jgi:hypothetical protein
MDPKNLTWEIESSAIFLTKNKGKSNLSPFFTVDVFRKACLYFDDCDSTAVISYEQ